MVKEATYYAKALRDMLKPTMNYDEIMGILTFDLN